MHGQITDEHRNQEGEREGDFAVAEAKPSITGWLAQPVRERGAKRARQYIRRPEHGDRVQTQPEISKRGEQYQTAKEQARAQVSEMQRDGRQIADRRAHSKRGHDSGPVEKFPARGGDPVYRQRVLNPLP